MVSFRWVRNEPGPPSGGEDGPGWRGWLCVGVAAGLRDERLGVGEVVVGVLAFGGCAVGVGEDRGGVVAGGQRVLAASVVVVGVDGVVDVGARHGQGVAGAHRCGVHDGGLRVTGGVVIGRGPRVGGQGVGHGGSPFCAVIGALVSAGVRGIG